MNAIRMRDGLPVMLKKVLPVESPHELGINQTFSSPELARRSDNHCVPMLDVIKLQRSGPQQLMVFPQLIPFHQSRIRTFEEFIIFITQICEVWPCFMCLDVSDSVSVLTGYSIYASEGRCLRVWLRFLPGMFDI